MPAQSIFFRLATTAILCACIGATAAAQHGQDVPPAPLNGSPNAANPTAAGVTEDQLFREMRKLQGRITIPDYKAAILEQPQGREYRAFHERVLPWLGGIAILGMLLLLALFYVTRGRIRLEDGSETGIKILRFNMFERFNHWMAATSFIVLALTGLNYVFGKRLLFPLIGPDAFAAWSQWAKFAHNTMAWPFILALIFMIIFWIRDNIPDRYDLTWLRQFGGFMSGTHPPARRFNAGQKLIFWSVAIGGTILAISGIVMLFPFWSLDINGMQIAQYFHATVGMLLIAVMIAHIYIGSLGMVGAYDAMGSGEVDLGWARAHHSVWVEEQQAKVETPDDKRIVPAE
jgi:formate dehydrogenase subunit gamma